MSSAKSKSPSGFPNSTPVNVAGAADAHVLPQLFELTEKVGSLTGDLRGIATQLTMISGQMADLSSQMTTLQTEAAKAKGFARAACIIVPMCAIALWWALGPRIEELMLNRLPEIAAAIRTGDQVQVP